MATGTLGDAISPFEALSAWDAVARRGTHGLHHVCSCRLAWHAASKVAAGSAQRCCGWGMLLTCKSRCPRSRGWELNLQCTGALWPGERCMPVPVTVLHAEDGGWSLQCAGTLWLGNAAYLYLSVSFIQMLKALMPVAVFCTGCTFGIESFSAGALANMVSTVLLGISLGSSIMLPGALHCLAAGRNAQQYVWQWPSQPFEGPCHTCIRHTLRYTAAYAMLPASTPKLSADIRIDCGAGGRDSWRGHCVLRRDQLCGHRRGPAAHQRHDRINASHPCADPSSGEPEVTNSLVSKSHQSC